MFSASRKQRRAVPLGTAERMPNHLSTSAAKQFQRYLQFANDAMASITDELDKNVQSAISYIRGSSISCQQSHPPLLIASVSSSTNNDPVSLLPSKDRSTRAAKKASKKKSGDNSPTDQPNSASPSPLQPNDGIINSKEKSTPSEGAEKKLTNEEKAKEEEEQERILISEIDVSGCSDELRQAALNVLTTRPNFAYSVKEIQDDVSRVFDTGYFSTCKPRAEDTRDGVRFIIETVPNPELRGVVALGASSLPQKVIQDAFRGMQGRTLNYNGLSSAVAKLNAWYEKQGVLGQVVDVELSSNDIAQVKVAEAKVNRIALKYVDSKTGEAREEGKTRPDIIMRQVTLKPGQAYNLQQAKKDIEAVYSMGLFEDVSIRPQPAEGSTMEAPRVDLTLEVKERRKTGGLAAGGGISAAGTSSESSLPGFIGTVSYSQRNLFGLGQRLVASAEIGQLDSTFRVTHTDPWVRGDAYRTSRTISAQNTKTSAAPIHGRVLDELTDAGLGGGGGGGGGSGAVAGGGGAAAGGDGIFVSRVVGCVEYGRPLGLGWQGSLGVSWQRTCCVDDHNQRLYQDMYGGPLMINRGGKGYDTMSLGTIKVAYNMRAQRAIRVCKFCSAPSGDSELVASMEQAVPLQRDWLNFNRFTLRADRALPLGPLRLWISGKGGVIVGDLPPYEAFPIGGTNSVRGYSEGGVGSGRNYAAGTVELHFPLVSPVEGSIFADYGSDLGSSGTIPGDPAGIRNKPGSGYGIGAGVRIDTPIGPLRLEYAMNDTKQRRFHLGIGSHG